MLRLLSRGLLAGVLCLGSVALRTHVAYADDDEGFDDDEGGDEAGSTKGGDDDAGDNEEEEEVDKDQPPLTAGGLFTLNTYPVREFSRPLTLTKDIVQLRVGAGNDISAKGAFASGGMNVE